MCIQLFLPTPKVTTEVLPSWWTGRDVHSKEWVPQRYGSYLTVRDDQKASLRDVFLLPGRKKVAPKNLYQFFFGEEELEAENF